MQNLQFFAFFAYIGRNFIIFVIAELKRSLMTDQELKDLVASIAVENREAAAIHKETEQLIKEAAAIHKETDLLIKETSQQMKETDRRMQETDKIVKEASEIVKETSKTVKDIARQMGGIDENQGHHAEQYFQEILMEKLTFGGQKYDRMIPNLECFGKNGVSLIEFDMVLVNGKSVAIVETKNRIHPAFVRKLVEERLPKFREFFPEFSKYKAYLGIAGFSFSKKVLEEAKKYGICIVRQVGDSIEIEAGNLRVY